MATAVVRVDDAGLKAVLVATDREGNAAVLPNVPVWSVTVDGIVTMTVAEDGMSATFVPDVVGEVTVNVVVEADVEPGVNTLHASGDISVIAAEAASLDLQFTMV